MLKWGERGEWAMGVDGSEFNNATISTIASGDQSQTKGLSL